MDTFTKIANFFGSQYFLLLIRLTVLFVAVVWLSSIYWTFRDANRRGALGIYWSAVTLLFPFFGWMVYMILRPPELLEDTKERELEIRTKEAVLKTSDVICPACGRPIEKEFLICPYCLKKLKTACPSCHRPLRLSWKICPYCKQNL